VGGYNTADRVVRDRERSVMTRNDIVFAARTTISSTGTTNWRMSTVLGLLCGRRTDD